MGRTGIGSRPLRSREPMPGKSSRALPRTKLGPEGPRPLQLGSPHIRHDTSWAVTLSFLLGRNGLDGSSAPRLAHCAFLSYLVAMGSTARQRLAWPIVLFFLTWSQWARRLVSASPGPLCFSFLLGRNGLDGSSAPRLAHCAFLSYLVAMGTTARQRLAWPIVLFFLTWSQWARRLVSASPGPLCFSFLLGRNGHDGSSAPRLAHCSWPIAPHSLKSINLSPNGTTGRALRVGIATRNRSSCLCETVVGSVMMYHSTSSAQGGCVIDP